MSHLAIATHHDDRPESRGHNAGGDLIALAPGVDLPGVVSSYDRDEEIFAEEEAATHVYKVLSGAVRVTRLLSDGRRHIAAFHLPGDIFGIEIGGTHGFTAEAISSCRIACVKRSVIAARAEANSAAIHGLWRVLAGQLRQAQEHCLLLGRMSAAERVSTFLRDMARRGAADGVVDLPMSRTDIADYLGLTIETVSRTLTLFQRQGVIGIEGARHIVLRNRPALANRAA